MADLGILELLIACFLFMPLCKPYFKSLAKIDGFIWLPPLALFCSLALFPAYGFRPECIPLAIYAFINNCLSSRSFFASLTKLRYTDDERGPLYSILMLVFLVGTVFIAIRFLPLTDGKNLTASQTITVRDTLRNNEYYINIYDTSVAAASKPVILAIPPLAGSASIIDQMCTELAKEKVTVVSFSRKGFDIPAFNGEDGIVLPESRVVKNFLASLWNGTQKERENNAGRLLENERIKDLEFVLPFVITNYKPNAVYIIAWGTGASALIELFTSENVHGGLIRGGIIIEGRLFSFYELPPSETEPYSNSRIASNIAAKHWTEFQTWLASLKNKRVVPMPILPKPQIPLLYIASDMISATTADQQRPYQAALEFTRHYGDVMQIRAVHGAGSADFSDAPLKYPVITTLAGSLGKRRQPAAEIAHTTQRIILDFIQSLEPVLAEDLTEEQRP
ncbi:MAG: hypothetical protein LBD22_01045 [Spirochaetaceae bacterium]|jgi:hypothetical protein|nr:hypothetical protein [Spirochaetaceae bacterium]